MRSATLVPATARRYMDKRPSVTGARNFIQIPGSAAPFADQVLPGPVPTAAQAPHGSLVGKPVATGVSPSPTFLWSAVPSKFEQDLRALELSHGLFKLADTIEELAAQGEFNATRFIELRDFLLTRAHEEKNTGLVGVLDHVGQAAFGLAPQRAHDLHWRAMRPSLRTQAPGPAETYVAGVALMSESDSQEPHLARAQEMADRHLTAAVWSILFARQGDMTREAFDAATQPYRASISSDAPLATRAPSVERQAEADNRLAAVRSYFDKLETGIRGSRTVFTR